MLKLETFPLNNHPVRVLATDDGFWFVSSDCNKAVGFTTDNTAIDQRSIRLDSITKIESIMDSHPGLPLKSDTLLIRLGAFLQWIEVSKVESIQDLKEWVVKLRSIGGEKEFAKQVGLTKSQPLLESTTPMENAKRMATAAYGTGSNKMSAGQMLDLIGWNSIAEWLIELGQESTKGVKDAEERNRIKAESLIYNQSFRYWLNRQIADMYRAKHGEEPPRKTDKKASAYVYPTEYKSVINTYLDIYADTPEIAE